MDEEDRTDQGAVETRPNGEGPTREDARNRWCFSGTGGSSQSIANALGSDVVLANIPLPARFAFHKLWISLHRPPAFQAKAKKDRIQAEQLIEVLIEDRPGDLRDAWGSLPRTTAKRIRTAMKGFDAETLRQALETVPSD